MKDMQKVQPQYVPDIPIEFKRTLKDEEIIKPKNRFKNWQPKMRDLESTYDVKTSTWLQAVM